MLKHLRHLALILITWAMGSGQAIAQSCPDAGSKLSIVRGAINDLGKSDRAPAAADCALRWASAMTLEPEQLGDNELLRFFQEAADLHHRAYEQRLRAGLAPAANKYLNDEIMLRRKFLEAALQRPETSTDQSLRKVTVRHLSALTNALALAQQFAEVDKFLANTSAAVIDESAVNIWLQAIWSCAKFDGLPSNLCTADNQLVCKEKVSNFLSSIDEMKGRAFPRQTSRDITKLRNLAGDGGCLK